MIARIKKYGVFGLLGALGKTIYAKHEQLMVAGFLFCDRFDPTTQEGNLEAEQA